MCIKECLNRIGKSVSRVGGKAQIPAYRKVAGDLRLSYTQFHELESFARFGARLDDSTRKSLNHGLRVREALKQDQFSPLTAARQIAVLLAVTRGYLDPIPENRMARAQEVVFEKIEATLPDLEDRIDTIGSDDPLWEKMDQMIRDAIREVEAPDADPGSSG